MCAPVVIGATRPEPGVRNPARSTRRGRLWAEALDIRARRPTKKFLTGLRAFGVTKPHGRNMPLRKDHSDTIKPDVSSARDFTAHVLGPTFRRFPNLGALQRQEPCRRGRVTRLNAGQNHYLNEAVERPEYDHNRRRSRLPCPFQLPRDNQRQ